VNRNVILSYKYVYVKHKYCLLTIKSTYDKLSIIDSDLLYSHERYGESVTERSKVALSLTADAMAVLEKHATERKRGEFVSNLLIAYGAEGGAITQVDIESMRLQLLGLASTSKTLDGRLTKVERQLAAVIAERSK
jgi:hypothetical protein